VVDWQWSVIDLVRATFRTTQDGLDSFITPVGHLDIVYSIHAVSKNQVPGERTKELALAPQLRAHSSISMLRSRIILQLPFLTAFLPSATMIASYASTI
jgi:hypothetical protein